MSSLDMILPRFFLEFAPKKMDEYTISQNAPFVNEKSFRTGKKSLFSKGLMPERNRIFFHKSV